MPSDDGLSPLDLRNCLCANLRKTDRALTRLYDHKLRPSGLTATQFALLSVLTEVGSLRISDLAGVMVMEQTTVTRNVELLKKAGLVQTAAGGDRRVRQVSVTPGGKEAHARAFPLWAEVQTALTEGLGQDRWPGLLEDLSRLRKLLS